MLLRSRCFPRLSSNSEAIQGRELYRTVADVWHHTITSNAVNDITHANAGIRQWALSQNGELTVIEKFMQQRSVGRIRLGHVYKDTEDVLLEMAREDGIEEKFTQWIHNSGYVPESLFYSMIGWPERIILHDPIFREIHDTSIA